MPFLRFIPRLILHKYKKSYVNSYVSYMHMTSSRQARMIYMPQHNGKHVNLKKKEKKPINNNILSTIIIIVRDMS